MAYSGVIFFANMGGGGGQNYFQFGDVQDSGRRQMMHLPSVPNYYIEHPKDPAVLKILRRSNLLSP